MIKEIVKYEEKIRYDTSKKHDALKKVMNVSRLNGLRWKGIISLEMILKKLMNDILSLNMR